MGTAKRTIESILVAVTGSGCLGKSERQIALLKYLLTETEAGRGERIKAYSIALDVLDRDEDFDNSLDSIVRVEMHRLRKNLEIFNTGDHAFTLIIPKAHYTPVIVEKDKQKTLPSSVVMSTVLALMIVIFLALFAGSVEKIINSSDGNKVPNHKTFRATISFPTALNQTAKKQNSALYTKFVQKLQYSLIEHSLVVFTADQQADYHFELQFNEAILNKTKSVSVSVFTNERTLVWHNDYPLNTVDGSENTSAIVEQIYATLFGETAMIINYHATNPEIKKSRRFLYQCLLDTLTYTRPDIPRHLGPNPLDCLQPNLAIIPSDKHLLHIARADIYTGIITGHFPFNVKRPLEKAERELEAAKKYGIHSVYYLYINLRLERLKHPINKTAILQILNDMETDQPNSELLQYIIASTQAEVFANWDIALPLADKLLKSKKNQQSVINWIYVRYYISKGKWEMAKQALKTVPAETGKNSLTERTSIICNTRSTNQYANITLALTQAKLRDKASYVAFIKAQQDHQIIKEQLMKPEMFETCPVFQMPASQ